MATGDLTLSGATVVRGAAEIESAVENVSLPLATDFLFVTP